MTTPYDGRVTQDAVASIDAVVRAEMERCRQPGAAVGLTDADRTLAVRTYGLADLASQRLVGLDTLFEVGSIGKSFTAAAILQLADAGRIDLDAPVSRYLPWFSVPGQDRSLPITLAHLLSHTAGIAAGVDATPEAAFQVWALRDLPTFSRPGERFHYSNVGYKALGLVLEEVEGRPYPEVLRARILEPLGMASTEAAITHAIRSRLAVGYDYLHDDRIGHAGAELAPEAWLETGTADVSIASTAADMCAFMRMLLRGGAGPNGRLLSERAFAQMTTGHARDGESGLYGYGLSMHELDGRRLVGHGGGMVGYAAAMETDPEAGLGVIVLQNAASLRPMALAREALRMVREGRPGSMTAPVAAAAADGLAGTYSCGDAARRTIEIAGGEPPVLRTGEADVELELLGDDLFLAPHDALDRFPIHVVRSNGGATELWHGCDRYVRAGAPSRRLPEPRPELRAIAGHYRSHNPWTTNFRVLLRGDEPWLFFPAAPDGFETEQRLVPRPDGSFRVGGDPGSPEGLRFDTIAVD